MGPRSFNVLHAGIWNTMPDSCGSCTMHAQRTYHTQRKQVHTTVDKAQTYMYTCVHAAGQGAVAQAFAQVRS